jgi:hydrogenase maturation protein HypF
VQGVGFRPFVARLATELGVFGSVRNTGEGVAIHAEADPTTLDTLCEHLATRAPRAAAIDGVVAVTSAARGARAFAVEPSHAGTEAPLLAIGPDLATCPDCLAELRDPGDRRYRYPFLNCTQCGPRFSILVEPPYDRANTTMRRFTMCASCRAEYEDPSDRRFHAQPNACAACGPRLALVDRHGAPLVAEGDDVLEAAAERLLAGEILAIQGLGGFHLSCAATDDRAVRTLRARKRRGRKPLAVLFDSVDSIRAHVHVSEAEEALLASPAAPIVLLRKRRRADAALAEDVAPQSPDLGCFVAHTPQQHLLFDALARRAGSPVPLVATSGNVSDEPICTAPDEARTRLADLADAFLVHDRPIERPVDDSVARVVDGAPMLLRRGRGFAPLALHGDDLPAHGVDLAVGGHMKNAIAWRRGRSIVLSQHVGDLDAPLARASHERAIDDVGRLVHGGRAPDRIVRDLHPDYGSTIEAERRAADTPAAVRLAVPHHAAHVLATLFDRGSSAAVGDDRARRTNDARAPRDERRDLSSTSGVAHAAQPFDHAAPAVGIAWDGVGLGPRGAALGGEFFVVPSSRDLPVRVASFAPWPLPGGDLAARDPRRCALGLLASSHAPRRPALRDALRAAPVASLVAECPDGARLATRLTHLALSASERIATGHAANGAAAATSSVGRLFDAVASMLGICHAQDFEAEAAMRLEACAETLRADDGLLPAFAPLPFTLRAPFRARGPAPSPAPDDDFASLSFVVDLQPTLEAFAERLLAGDERPALALAFHDTLAAITAAAVERMETGRIDTDRIDADRNAPTSERIHAVALAGGCFHNRILAERTLTALRAAGRTPLLPRRIPSGDGGLAVGQIVYAVRAAAETCPEPRRSPHP